MERVYNFSPGPSMLAEPVLEQAQKDMMCYGTSGMSVMEMSHRSKMYIDIYDRAVADLRELMDIPDDYEAVSYTHLDVYKRQVPTGAKTALMP